MGTQEPRRRHLITVDPSGATIEVDDGETLFDAAHRLGHTWPTLCGGQAECRACHVRVTADAENAVPPATREAESLATLAGTHLGKPGTRLACQLTVTGPVTVVKRGWRPAI